MKQIKRRTFLQAAGVLGLASGVKVAQAGGGASNGQPIIIDLFMRGGMDGFECGAPIFGCQPHHI